MNEQLRKCVRLLTPPLVALPINAVRARAKAREGAALFDGDDELFKRVVSSATNYAEYGCGRSTIWVAKNTKAHIHSIDTSRHWLDLVRKKIGTADANLQWIDCGSLGEWGNPLGFEKRDNFKKYPLSIWTGSVKPDTILVDGRFRVACFLTSLKYADEGTRIIFDDYTHRPQYQIVEEFVPRAETCGRQCLFIVPPKQNIDHAALDRVIDKFEYVIG